MQLVEAKTATSLWAERFDRNLEDILALQDEIALQVAGAIEPELLKKEGQRAASRDHNATVWDLLRRGTWEFHKVRPESHRAARELFLKVIEASPDSADGHIWLARVDAGMVGWRWTDDPAASAAEGMAAALRAVQLDGQNPYSHYAVAITHISQVSWSARVRPPSGYSSEPQLRSGPISSSVCLCCLDQPHDAIRELENGLRLNPFDPHGLYWRSFSRWPTTSWQNRPWPGASKSVLGDAAAWSVAFRVASSVPGSPGRPCGRPSSP